MEDLIVSNKCEGMRFDKLKIVEGKALSGKTSYAVNEAVRKAKEGGQVIYFSTDEKAESILMRIVEVLDGLKDNEEKLIHNYAEELLMKTDFKFYSPKSLLEVYDKIKENGNNDEEILVIIDSISMLKDFRKGKDLFATREKYLGLESIAKDMNLRFILTKQLSRS